MAKKTKVKKPVEKFLTQKEKEDANFANPEGATLYEITRNGVTYGVNSKGELFPLSGKAAQKALKKPKTPKKPKEDATP